MPNWVRNRIVVVAEKEVIEQLQDKWTRPYTFRLSTSELVDGEIVSVEEEVLHEGFSFHNIIPSPAVDTDKDGFYKWNMTHWGCKWDASYPEIRSYPVHNASARSLYEYDEGDNAEFLELIIDFETPWSEPRHVIDKLIEYLPTLNARFSYFYEEEQGFGACFYYNQQGTCLLADAWEAPESHADYESRRSLDKHSPHFFTSDGCPCEGYEPIFEDCPKP